MCGGEFTDELVHWTPTRSAIRDSKKAINTVPIIPQEYVPLVKFVDVPVLDRIFHGSLQQKIWQPVSVPGFYDKPDRWNASAVQNPDRNSKGIRIFHNLLQQFY